MLFMIRRLKLRSVVLTITYTGNSIAATKHSSHYKEEDDLSHVKQQIKITQP